MGVFAGPEITESGLVLALDGANKKSFYGYWSGSYGTAANAFDGNLNTFSGGAGGTFSATYTFNNGLDVSGTVRVYVTFGASSGQVNGRTGVILIDGIDISSKMDAANVYASSPGWVDVTSEVGSIFNTVVLNGTSGSTNPSIAAIEVNGQILVGTTWAGTAWTDLSTNGNTGTLVNGVGYSASNGGALSFDGVDDRVSTNYKPSGERSYFIWVKFSSLTHSSGYQLTGTQEGNAYTYIGIQNGGDIYYYAGASTGGNIGNPVTVNTWVNLGFALFPDGSRRVYKNGVEIHYNTGGLGGTATLEFSVGCINQNHFITGNISQVSIYNRALSAAEVSQNFNALRGRFGI